MHNTLQVNNSFHFLTVWLVLFIINMLVLVLCFKHYLVVSSNLGVNKRAILPSDKQQDSDNKGSEETVDYEAFVLILSLNVKRSIIWLTAGLHKAFKHTV